MAQSAPTGPSRDFVGYGRRVPDVRWPDDASLVVNIVLNYESGAEYSMLDGDPHNDSWGEYSYQIGPERRDLGTETHFEFGSPGRRLALRKAVRPLLGPGGIQPDVSFMRRAEIARWWIAHARRSHPVATARLADPGRHQSIQTTFKLSFPSGRPTRDCWTLRSFGESPSMTGAK